jgi:hypothetical protein
MRGNEVMLTATAPQRRRGEPLASIPDRFGQHGVKLALAEFLRLPPTVFRDTFFATGRAQAANNAGLRFGIGLILGFAVGGL